MKTIKDVLKNQKIVSDQIYNLVMQGKEEEVLDLIARFGYEIRTENQAPLDEKPEFDNEAHELAIFLNDVIQRIERGTDLTNLEEAKLLRTVKQAVKGITGDLLKTSEIRRNLSSYDAEKYKASLAQGIKDAEAELTRVSEDFSVMSKIGKEIFGEPDLAVSIREKDNQISDLDTLKAKIEELKRVQDNKAMLDPSEPDYSTMLAAHEAKIEELTHGRAGIDARIASLRASGLNVTDIENAVRTDLNNIANISRMIDSKKETINKGITKDYNQIMKNLRAASKKYASYAAFIGIDFSKMDPNTPEGRKAIEAGYKPFYSELVSIQRRRDNAQNNITNFSQEITTLDRERTILDKDTTDRVSYIEGFDDETKRKIQEEKDRMHQDNRDKVYGNKEKAEKYKKLFLELQSNRAKKTKTYVDRNGVTKTVEIDTIQEYPGMKEALEFMQLTSYVERLERISMYEQTRDLYAYCPEEARRLDAATTEEERNAIKAEISRMFEIDSNYTRTFHGAHNTTRMTYENYMTAGSALKAMVPLKKADNFPGKLKIAAQNVGRYTGLKIPRFSRINENGEKVSDIPTGLVTVAADAAIIGTTIAMPAAMALAYGAKTAVVLGMRMYGKHYYKKHEDEMNIPTPYDGKSGPRRVARERFYKEKGHSQIGSWARSWVDHIRPVHRRKVEDKIIEDRNKDIDISIDNSYAYGAMRSDILEQDVARRNQIARANAHEQIKQSGAVYNDIYREPGVATKPGVDSRVNQAVAIGLAGGDVEDPSKISYTDSKRPRSTNFAKAKVRIRPDVITRDIDDKTHYGDRVGETIWSHSIQGEDIATSVSRRTDRKRRILTALAGLGLKALGHTINDKKIIETEQEVGTGEYEQVQVGTKPEKYITGYNTKQVPRDAELSDIKISDLERVDDKGDWAAFNDDEYYASGYHPAVSYSPNDNTIQGIAIRWQDPTTGRTETFSISSSYIKNIVRNDPRLNEFTEVYASGELGLKPDTTLEDILQFMPESDRKSYLEYLSQTPGSDVKNMVDTMEFAWGRSEHVIGIGWSRNGISDDQIRAIWDTVVDYNNPIYGTRYVPQYEMREILEKAIVQQEVTDEGLHAIKDALEKTGLATALQQIAEAVNEAGNPVKERDSRRFGRPYAKLDKPEDMAPRRKIRDDDRDI